MSNEDIEITSQQGGENIKVSERDFDQIKRKMEKKVSRRLKDTDLGQRKTLRLIENLSSKVNSLANSISEPSISNSGVNTRNEMPEDYKCGIDDVELTT